MLVQEDQTEEGREKGARGISYVPSFDMLWVISYSLI